MYILIIITKEVEVFQSVEVMTRVVIIVVCFFNGGDRQTGRLYY